MMKSTSRRSISVSPLPFPDRQSFKHTRVSLPAKGENFDPSYLRLNPHGMWGSAYKSQNGRV